MKRMIEVTVRVIDREGYESLVRSTAIQQFPFDINRLSDVGTWLDEALAMVVATTSLALPAEEDKGR